MEPYLVVLIFFGLIGFFLFTIGIWSLIRNADADVRELEERSNRLQSRMQNHNDAVERYAVIQKRKARVFLVRVSTGGVVKRAPQRKYWSENLKPE